MLSRRRNNSLGGQISIFDLEIVQPQTITQENKPVFKKYEDKFGEIINLYRSSATRIVRQACGALLVAFGDRTLYFNPLGINELELKKDMELLPYDEILVVNQDIELNELQLEKLKDMQVSEYIKRKGDANIIIPRSDKTIVINPKGWVLEYSQKAMFHEDELYSTEIAKENTDLVNKSTKVDMNIPKNLTEQSKLEESITDFQNGDRVEIEYGGIKSIGKIVSIYNKGETLNVKWDGKQTAFYYKFVKKLDKEVIKYAV